MTDKRLRQVEQVVTVVADRHGQRLAEIAMGTLGRELTHDERSVLEIALLFGSVLTSVEMMAAFDRLRQGSGRNRRAEKL